MMSDAETITKAGPGLLVDPGTAMVWLMMHHKPVPSAPPPGDMAPPQTPDAPGPVNAVETVISDMTGTCGKRPTSSLIRSISPSK